MENELFPKRKNTRLTEFDYNTDGAYFITVCTHDRKSTLARVVGAIHESPETKLTEYGKILDEVINNIPSHLSVTVDRYVIMPNHFHVMLIVHDTRAIRESPLRSNRSVISKTMGYIKMNTSKIIHQRYNTNEPLWQRGFYDHIIRNQEDFEKHIDYICNNPIKWEFDKLYPDR